MSAANKLKVILFLGSTRDNRYGERVGIFMKKFLEGTNHDVTLFDPLHMPFTMLSKPVFHYGPERKGAPEWLVAAENKIKEADAFVIVTPEYNHSLPPALTNMLDHFGSSVYSWKPSAIVCYSAGIYGGMRAAMQARALLGEIGALAISNIFGIPQVMKAFDEAGNPQDSHMESGAKKLITQLDWYANALKNHRQSEGIPN
ncbi:DgyrCDS5246 [Dimorphilus gyrociliatus]|uniref:DgyrCDS5246 n=1 Tax=Dimorphilus gyrociliatus TaxID=2664684 RepID=A0A7I8VJA9_9ANNE|nr:DgyrCDS5246 [Dimorphilus gyrociliatus]